ncbi:MAG TPA: HIT domain-containing protein [Acidobacteriaceae bacterium]|nr:HIT domain-containing protein [Acidobacteriaceae bacterium]
MDYLWTPWRYSYITDESDARKGVPSELSAWPEDHGCVFCNMIAATDYAIAHGTSRDDAERASGIVFRGERVFVCLNRFPYNSGHIMVLPYEHQSSLAALPLETAHEIMELAQRIEKVYAKVYHPDGVNLGLNLGKAAGAGVAMHLHLHAVPRWVGDTNFMTVTGETRILPEELPVTWRRLRDAFSNNG